MPEQNSNPSVNDGNHADGQEPHRPAEKFESDTQKVIRKHLENKDHVITEEEIASLRVGMVPPMDEATAARFEDEETVENVEDDIAGDEKDMDESKNERDNRLTSWDTIDNS